MSRRLIVVLVLVAILSTGAFLGSVFTSALAGNEDAEYESLGTVMEVIALIKTRYYFQPVNTFDLVRGYISNGTINGMLSESLDDPYTKHMDQVAFERMMSNTKGVYGGIGIVVGIQDERLTVISPIKGTPGERAGLRRLDKIVGIDGKETTYMGLDEAVSLMRGPEGEDITLSIEREEEVFDVHIVRELINVESVPEPKVLDADIGYVQITNFSERTYQELVKALDQLEESGAKALVLDLRFNPGGTLNAALQVADEFVSGAPLLYLEDKDGNRSAFASTTPGTRSALPMAVLINGGSASASEIVAGALRDNELATLIGTKTFGKGLVQSMYPLRDGSAMTVTEQAYLTSGGHNINKIGIEPDIEIEVTPEEEEALYLGDEVEDVQLEKAKEILRAQM